MLLKTGCKFFKIFIFTVFFYVPFAFADYNPGGEAKLGNSVPSAYLPYAPNGTSHLSKPYPTNKWYTSYLHVPVSNIETQYTLNTHPLNYKFKNTAYVQLGCPVYTASSSRVYMNTTDYFANVSASTAASVDTAASYTTAISSYSDWSAVLRRTLSSDSSKWFTATVGKGFLFSYFNYSSGLNPVILHGNSWSGGFTFYDSSGTVLTITGTPVITDSILVKSSADGNVHYFGIFAPYNTEFVYDAANKALILQFDSALSENQRLMSIGYIQRYDENPAAVSTKFENMKKYAYNFVTGTKSSYEVTVDLAVKTKFEFTFNRQRTGSDYEDGAIFALYPHQWRNISALSGTAIMPPGLDGSAVFVSTYASIKGRLKAVSATSFEVTNYFNGILPNFTYEIPDNDVKFSGYINIDKNFKPGDIENPDIGYNLAVDTYYIGRGLGKSAGLAPVFHQLANASGAQENITNRNNIINELKAELIRWYAYNGQSDKYFAYDNLWGGLIGINPSHSLQHYNDHHFHYGYFVYASAILALFDTDFAVASKYKGMVDLLIRDMNSPARNDPDFPFLRNLDVYAGHCWANGMGGWEDQIANGTGYNSVDQESSGEAMNAWTGIYLWGLATNNQELINLGIYGYTTEYSAIKEYYFDVSGENYADFRGPGGYAHNSVGILWDNAIEYYVLWRAPYSAYGAPYPQEIKGVQVMPATPSMTYLGYDKTYAENFYNAMSSEANNTTSYWADIWSRFISFFNPAAAISLLTTNESALNASSSFDTNSTSFTYHFIKFFEKLGNVATSANSGNDYYASGNAAYSVMDKSGEKTYIAFNNSNAYKNVTFHSRQTGSAGSMEVPPMTTASTKDFKNFKYDSLRTMYSNGNDYALLMDVYSAGYTAAAASTSSIAIDAAYYQTFPFAFNLGSPSGVLNNVTGYVQVCEIMISSDVSANQIKLAAYNPSGQLFYPSQSIMEISESSGTANVRIKADFTSTGTYVLVIPVGAIHIANGTLLNAKDGSNVSAAMQIYDSLTKSTTSQTFTGSYNINVIEGRNYVLTPVSENFIFSPANFSFTVLNSDITNLDFTAHPKYELGGAVTFSARAMNKIAVNIYDVSAGSTKIVTTGIDGKYTGYIYYGNTYIITPVSSEYDFTPPSVTINNVQQQHLGVDFYARIADGRFVAYPNPYKPSKHGSIGITFAGLKQGAEIKIYNIAGELVFDTKASADGPFVWYAENNYGNQAASGVYIYHIKSGGKTHKGKVAVER